MSAVWRVLKMPWLASVRSSTGWAFVIVWFMLFTDAVRAFGVRGGASQLGMALLLLALAFVWRMVASTLWLARDARALRLPGIGQDADTALALFALLTVVVPALLLGLAFGHPLDWLVALGLIAVGTLGACILPLLLVLCVFLALFGVVILRGAAPPGPGSSAFLAWSVPTLIALTVIVLQRWTTLRRTGAPITSRWFRPAMSNQRMLALRRLHGGAFPAFDATDFGKPRKSPASTLNRIGPAFPVRSIRVALGGGMLPFDLMLGAAWRRQQVLLVVLLLLPSALALLAVQLFDAPSIAKELPQLLLIAGVASMVPTLRVVREMSARWNGRHAELALLALLPRLVDDARRARAVLLACVARQVEVKLGLGVALVLACVVLRVPPAFYVFLLLIIGCGVLAEFALAIRMLSGTMLRGWRMRVPGWSMLIPLVASMLSVDPTVVRPHSTWLSWPELVALALWVLWLAFFTALCLRGWRALHAQPHPFLANSRT